MVNVLPLDSALLENIADRYILDDLHFSKAPQSRVKEREIALQSVDGKKFGYLVWQPELPGTKILHVLVPTSLGLVSILIALIGFLSRMLWRAARSQAGVMTELRASEAQAQHLAFHDVVTGLANRALFDDRLDQAMARAQRGACVALLALDLDRFKHVNDTLGHQAGDALLRELGGRLSTLLRPSDTVARVGGDEFNILLCDINGSHDVLDVSQRILNSVRQPFAIFGREVFVGISIGVALSPENTTDRGELLREADVALYVAKAAGRDCVRCFTPAMDDSVKLRSQTEDELREALGCPGQLCLYFQPEVRAATRQIIGLEALLRWNHPTRGLIPPDQFIPIAEDTGLINQIGEWVLGEAARTAVRWPGLFMAVNLSPVQFRTTGFAETVIRIVKEAGCEPSRIELEITERVLLDDDERCHETVRTLRMAGFRIALDDFGSGYSSLSYLRRFTVDKIKIDRSYTENLGQTVDSAAIVTSVINLGRLMGLTVTAEGVETHDQMKALRAAGCEELQGYLFSKAVLESDLGTLFAAEAIGHVA
jgi:diguanylate cyclase (GGDEF)-like protein